MQTIGAETAAVQRRLRKAPPGDRPDDADLIFLMIDIDKFKSVNDEFGHKAGDAVLAQVADVLNESCRASDVVARWGGDEFLVVSRFTDRQRGSALAERIRSAMERHAFDLGDGRIVHRACSVGVAAYPFSLDARRRADLGAGRRGRRPGAVSRQASRARTRGSAWPRRPPRRRDAAGRRPEESLSRWIADGIVTVEEPVTRRRIGV